MPSIAPSSAQTHITVNVGSVPSFLFILTSLVWNCTAFQQLHRPHRCLGFVPTSSVVSSSGGGGGSGGNRRRNVRSGNGVLPRSFSPFRNTDGRWMLYGLSSLEEEDNNDPKEEESAGTLPNQSTTQNDPEEEKEEDDGRVIWVNLSEKGRDDGTDIILSDEENGEQVDYGTFAVPSELTDQDTKMLKSKNDGMVGNNKPSSRNTQSKSDRASPKSKTNTQQSPWNNLFEPFVRSKESIDRWISSGSLSLVPNRDTASTSSKGVTVEDGKTTSSSGEQDRNEPPMTLVRRYIDDPDVAPRQYFLSKSTTVGGSKIAGSSSSDKGAKASSEEGNKVQVNKDIVEVKEEAKEKVVNVKKVVVEEKEEVVGEDSSDDSGELQQQDLSREELTEDKESESVTLSEDKEEKEKEVNGNSEDLPKQEVSGEKGEVEEEEDGNGESETIVLSKKEEDETDTSLGDAEDVKQVEIGTLALPSEQTEKKKEPAFPPTSGWRSGYLSFANTRTSTITSDNDILNLIHRYVNDRDQLDYYYYDQEKLTEEYVTKGKKDTKKGSTELLSFFLLLFRKGKNRGEAEAPKLPSEIVAEYFSTNATYVDGAYYRPAVGQKAIVRHLGLFGSRRSLFQPLVASSSENDVKQKQQKGEMLMKRGVKMVMDDVAITVSKDGEDGASAIVRYHYEYSLDSTTVPDSRGVTFYGLSYNTFSSEKNARWTINEVFDVMEPPSPKPGDAGLLLLSLASEIIAVITGEKSEETVVPALKGTMEDVGSSFTEDLQSTTARQTENPGAFYSTPERYFRAFNDRNIPLAGSCMTSDVEYIDTQYPGSILGRKAFETQLQRVAKALPSTFRFIVDDVVEDGRSRGTVGVRWHVEDEDENGTSKDLPFTRGASLFRLTDENLISYGFDVPEPAVIKPGAFLRVINLVRSDISRLIPLTVWILYVSIVFFSDGIIPGANALELEGRTWDEVFNLSLNFFLVSPTLDLPIAGDAVHPMLEGVFNFLLSWAALFSGFLSDERDDKPNVLDGGWTVLGMQFLTSAFYLPYLVCRTPESPRLVLPRHQGRKERKVVYDDVGFDKNGEILGDFVSTISKEDIAGSFQRLIAENRKLHAALGAVGFYSILWGLFARADEGFGDTIGERWSSFGELLSIDRVGCSFLVDLAIFGVFQGWLVDDDLRRRGVDPSTAGRIRTVAQYVPFFGLVAYFLLRPTLPSSSPLEDDGISAE